MTETLPLRVLPMPPEILHLRASLSSPSSRPCGISCPTCVTLLQLDVVSKNIFPKFYFEKFQSYRKIERIVHKALCTPFSCSYEWSMFGHIDSVSLYRYGFEPCPNAQEKSCAPMQHPSPLQCTSC